MEALSYNMVTLIFLFPITLEQLLYPYTLVRWTGEHHDPYKAEGSHECLNPMVSVGDLGEPDLFSILHSNNSRNRC